jgi:hypothetical protein
VIVLGRDIMGKLIKIILTISVFAAVAYTQTGDTSAKRDSISQSTNQPTTSTSAYVYPSGEKKVITNVIPKPKTNWSRVKDLFL